MIEGYKDSILGRIPKSWDVVKLGEVTKSFAGGTPNRSFTDYYNGTIPWIKSGEVNNNYIDSCSEYITELAVQESSAKLIEQNSILVALYGATAGKVGILKVKGCSNQAVLAINSSANILSNDFLYHYLKKSTSQLLKLCQGSGQPNLSKGIVDSINILIPSILEQQKIADILSTVDAKIEVIDQQIKETEELKNGLMQRLLTKGIGHTEFKDSPLGKIPKSWEVVKINELLESKRILGHLDGNHGGLYPKASEFIKEGVPYISANCFVNGRVDFNLCKHLSLERAMKFKKGVAKNGDVLFAHNATVGPVALLKTNRNFVILSTTATYYRLDNKTIGAEYWYYFLQTPAFKNQYEKVMGQSTRNQVPITMQRSFLSIIPPFIEQQEIVKVLIGVDEKQDINYKKKVAYNELKQGLMQQLLTGKIRVNNLAEA